MRARGIVSLLFGATAAVVVVVAGCDPFSSGDSGGDAASTDSASEEAPDGALTDATGGGDGGTGRFCASVDAAFCADFDGVDSVEGWMLQTAAAATTLDDTTTFVSPPRSLLISQSLVVGADTYGRLAHTLPGGPLDIVVEAQIRLAALPAGATVTPISLRFGSSANDAMRFETGLVQSSGGLEMFETEHSYPAEGGPQLSGTGFPYGDAGGFDGWTSVRIKLSLDRDGGTSTGTFRVGNGPDRTINLVAATAEVLAPPVILVIGMVDLQLAEAGTAQVGIDNVVIRLP